jgi:hypothetical protein
MSDLDRIGRRPVLTAISAAALAGFLRANVSPSKALDRVPSVLIFDVAIRLIARHAGRS